MEKKCVICDVTFIALRSDKETCSAKCRQKYWRQRSIESEEQRFEHQIEEYLSRPENVKLRDRLFNDLVEFGTSAVYQSPSEVKVIDPRPEAQKIFITPNPKNLEELKKLCPPELTGLERGEWIGRERQKYGI